MSRKPMPVPRMFCERCGAERYRKRKPIGSLQSRSEFMRGRYCSRRCAAYSQPRHRVDVASRFWRYVPVTANGCWEWSGTRNEARMGYGLLNVNRRPIGAHRISWELHFGPIPDGMQVCHRCDNPPCVRPDHLFLGAAADNTADMMAKGRRRQGRPRLGLDHHSAKLNAEIVAFIRSSHETTAELARRFGVASSTLRDARIGVTWREVA